MELAHSGDFVLWIKSDEAREQNWTSGPREVLEGAGLTTINVIPVAHVNDPALLTTKLKPVADSLAGQFTSTYLVTNGGTKHTPIGLLHAFEKMSPQMLYGDERPAMYSIYPAELTGSPKVLPYMRVEPEPPNRSSTFSST
ncbi:MAG TPA: hypothetical protein PKD72_04120 [Gemmatales bacterium]|nr:hypothetical protein [Gemmatales bacterium]